MNKGNLRSHFIAVLNRSDITNSLADTFIDQGIARIQRTLRIPAMEAQQTYAISIQTGSIVVPSDMLELMDAYYDKTTLTRVPMEEMLQMKDIGETGTPMYFTRERSKLLLYPEPASGSVVVNYYAEFAEMTSDSDENTIAKVASDLIVYAALTYAADYFLDERAELFTGKFGQFMAELQGQADDAETAGSLQVMRPSATYTD